MYQYRISKYDPQYRNEKGIYCREEWTSYCDIGKLYDGKIFSKDDYIKTETDYCNTILSILKNSEIKEVNLQSLELNFSVDEIKQMLQQKGLDLSIKEEIAINSLKNGDRIDIHDLQLYIKLVLRECFWCKFVDADSSIQIEFGYDYYIYLISKNVLSKEIAENCRQKGIFIERM